MIEARSDAVKNNIASDQIRSDQSISRVRLFATRFIIGDWNAKVGSQEITGVTGKFGLGVQNEAGQRLIEFCQENALIIANTLFQQHKRQLYMSTFQIVNTEIRLIIFFTAEDGKVLCSQQKQD